MNKGRRQELRQLKYKKRKANYMLDYDWHALKSDAKPCSCWMCRGQKFSRKVKHKKSSVVQRIEP